jgi:hypothetical protein
MSSKPLAFRSFALPDCSFWSRIGVPDNLLIQKGVTFILAAYFIRLLYNHFIQSQSVSKKPRQKSTTVRKFFFRTLSQSPPTEEVVAPIPQPSEIRYPNNVCPTKMTPSAISFKGPRIKQPFEVFLVLDIEGTCDMDTDFNYPNEIIVRARMTSWKIMYHFK